MLRLQIVHVLEEIYSRNSPLAITGWLCLLGALYSLIMILFSDVQVLGINAWIKPFKFFLSATIFMWTMAWYLHYLEPGPILSIYVWVVIAVMLFEVVYIAWQASKGSQSHFNVSSAFHSTMFSLMGTAISIMTFFTAYIGLQFFIQDLSDLPNAYLWGIRMGIILFVIFAFAGGIMGAKMSHTVGAPDGGIGIKFLNWSLTHGDLRIAHFAGMHALQVLPILGYYVLNSSRSLIIFTMIYFLVVAGVLIQALMGLPLIKS